MLCLKIREHKSITGILPDGRTMLINLNRLEGQEATIGIDAPKDVMFYRTEVMERPGFMLPVSSKETTPKLTPRQIELPRSSGPSPQWYVPAWNPGYYLHRDGVVRQHIFHHGEWLGYYATEAEALAVIAKFEAANAEVTK